MRPAETGERAARRLRIPAAAALAASLLTPAAAAAAQPGAFELLAAAREAYAGLEAYRDRGTIEEVGADGAVRTVARFETAALPAARGGGRFRLALAGPAGVEAAVWSAAGEAFAFDGATASYAPLGTAGPAAVRYLLPTASDALLVPGLLAGDTQALDFEAASFDGAEPCASGAPVGADHCFVVSAIRMSGALEYRLWLDADSRLVRRVELTAYPAEAILGRAAAEAGLSPRPPGTAGEGAAAVEPRIVRVTHEILAAGSAGGEETTAELFAPPADARRVALAELPAPPAITGPAGGGGEDEPRATFAERIEVRRIEVEVRVVDLGGEPVVALGPDDFRVELGGEEAAVEAVDWIPTGHDAFADLPWSELAKAGATVPAPGRLFVVFVQADMEPSRLRGHLRMLQKVDLLFADLQPDDRAAVVSFDSRLHLRQDFTADRERLASAVSEGTGFGGEAWNPRIPRFPSLARHLDAEEARRAATPERALELTAKAFARLPGPKSILWLGWGLGRFDARSGTVSPAPGYEEARTILAEAGIPVFVLDIADAASHSLELGLQQVAEDTGGRYERAAEFTDRAMKRIVRVMGDRYVLVFTRPAGLPLGEHRLKIELVGRRGTVLAPRTLADPT